MRLLTSYKPNFDCSHSGRFKVIGKKNKLNHLLNTGVLEYASNILGRVIFLWHNKQLRQKLLQSLEMKIKEFRVTLPMTVEEYQVPLVKTDTTMNIEQ